jgi:hypothetical protein
MSRGIPKQCLGVWNFNQIFVAQPQLFSAEKISRDINLALQSVSSPQNYSLAIIVVKIFTVFFAWVAHVFLHPLVVGRFR